MVFVNNSDSTNSAELFGSISGGVLVTAYTIVSAPALRVVTPATAPAAPTAPVITPAATRNRQLRSRWFICSPPRDWVRRCRLPCRLCRSPNGPLSGVVHTQPRPDVQAGRRLRFLPPNQDPSLLQCSRLSKMARSESGPRPVEFVHWRESASGQRLVLRGRLPRTR